MAWYLVGRLVGNSVLLNGAENFSKTNQVFWRENSVRF